MASWWKHKQSRSGNDSGDQDVTDNRIDAGKYADQAIKEILGCISSAIEAGKPIKDALLAYSYNVQNLETICYANEWIDEENKKRYDEVATTYLTSIKWVENMPLTIEQNFHLSNKKFEFLFKEILSNQMKYMEMEI